jgi:hypothetical protein
MPGWMACQDDFMPTDFLAKRPQLGGGLRPLKVICVSLNKDDQPPFRFLE